MRVVVADDSVLFREGLVRLLQEGGLEVVAQVATADELPAAIAEAEPDVLVVDIRMPPTHTDEGIVMAQVLRERHPDLAVLVLSHHVETAHAVRLLAAGAGGVGYLLKDRVVDVGEFVRTLHRLVAGDSVIDPEIVTRLLNRPRGESPLASLSRRERQVLELMAEGRSNRALCEQLHLSPKTLETHISSIFTKLGLLPVPEDHRRVLAVLTYLRAV